jgi:hypothetical protein
MSIETGQAPARGATVRGTLREVFSFPHPVNEYAARMVAGMVMALALVIIVFDVRLLTLFLAYGFLARVLTGPTLSPMGLLATRVLVPAIGNRVKPVAGPPKRFAQSIGLGFSATAVALTYGFGLPQVSEIVLGVLVLFAGLESLAGFCAGCFVFGYLMRWGLIPQDVCEACANWAPAKGPSATRAP